MPSISTPDPRHGPEWNTYEATILGLADTARGSLLSSIDVFAQKQAAIQDGIEFGGFALTHLSALISQLQAKVQTLQDGYEKLQSSINLATNTLMSPIFSLPDEILVEIMLSCSNGLPLISPRTRAWFPAVFTMVSRKWRELVYSSPRLWSSFQLFFEGPEGLGFGLLGPGAGEEDPRNVATISRLVDRHLTLSMPINLTIDISIPSRLPPTVLQQICKHSERWEHLVVGENTSRDIHGQDCSHRLPKLRSLNILLSDPMARPITTFDNVPELRSLTLRGEIGVSSPFSPHFPWHQLTHLTLHQHKHHYDVRFLSNAQNLISLSLRCGPNPVPIWSSYHRSGDPIIWQPFKHLRSLFVSSVALYAVNCLVVPSLEQLYLQGRDLCRPAANMIRRSGCSLTELTVVTTEQTVVAQDSDGIDELLAACPSLVVLNIQAEYPFINTVYVLLSDPTVVRYLSSLTIIYVGRAIDHSAFLSAPHPAAPYLDWTPYDTLDYDALDDFSGEPFPPLIGVSSHLLSDPLPGIPYSPSLSYDYGLPYAAIDDRHHVSALATAIRARLAILHSVCISNPITPGTVSTLSSLASEGINVKISNGRLQEEVTASNYNPQRREMKYGQVVLTY